MNTSFLGELGPASSQRQAASAGGDIYTTFIFGALMEIPAIFCVFALIDKLGRKALLAGGLTITSLCLISNLFIDEKRKQAACSPLVAPRARCRSLAHHVDTISDRQGLRDRRLRNE